MKELLKKLNNFRLTSSLIAGGALLEILMAVLFLVFYQSSGRLVDDGAETVVVALYNAKFWGMIYFLVAFTLIVVGITLIYKAIPFIFPKAKETPIKSLGWLFVSESALLLIMAIISFVIVGNEFSYHVVGFLICGIISLLCNVYAALLIYPWIKCRFYCPDVEKKSVKEKNA